MGFLGRSKLLGQFWSDNKVDMECEDENISKEEDINEHMGRYILFCYKLTLFS